MAGAFLFLIFDKNIERMLLKERIVMLTASLILGGAMVGSSLFSSFMSNKASKRSLRAQREALELMKKEYERQRQREIEQQKRENEELMNSVSNLTNTTFSGVSSPSVDYDKYGDLG